jgi:hypothetical protein
MLGPVICTPLLDRMSIQLQLALGNTADIQDEVFSYREAYQNIIILAVMSNCSLTVIVNEKFVKVLSLIPSLPPIQLSCTY